jgi:deoxyinosine 3'endonuclease (endonuclease V)
VGKGLGDEVIIFITIAPLIPFPMILAVDVYYEGESAKAVGVLFNWKDDKPAQIYTAYIDKVAPYEPGRFYKRELPCIQVLLEDIEDNLDAIIVDGYVYASNTKAYGLGGHLYEDIARRAPVIGVAKTPFKNNEETCMEITRGDSKKPLYVSAIGIDLAEAAVEVAGMHGEFRIPTVLKELDRLTREK